MSEREIITLFEGRHSGRPLHLHARPAGEVTTEQLKGLMETVSVELGAFALQLTDERYASEVREIAEGLTDKIMSDRLCLPYVQGGLREQLVHMASDVTYTPSGVSPLQLGMELLAAYEDRP